MSRSNSAENICILAKVPRAVSEPKIVWLSCPVIVRIKGRNPNARFMHGLTIKPVTFAVEKYLVVFDVKIEILSGLFFVC